jgi:predicted nuclease of predicted toxin-antitoxin system
MASLYSNENFPLPVVEKPREAGHDVLTIQEAGKSDQALPDAEVLAFAKRENRAVLTLNRLHFIRLHREQPDHAGIIVCKFDPDFVRQGELQATSRV